MEIFLNNQITLVVMSGTNEEYQLL